MDSGNCLENSHVPAQGRGAYPGLSSNLVEGANRVILRTVRWGMEM